MKLLSVLRRERLIQGIWQAIDILFVFVFPSSDSLITRCHLLFECFSLITQSRIRTRIRVLLSFFGIPRSYLRDNGLEPAVVKLLWWIESNERDEWVKVVAGLLNQSITGECSGLTKEKLSKFMEQYKEDVKDLVVDSPMGPEALYFLPLEFALLQPALVPDKSLFTNNHFHLDTGAKSSDFKLKKRLNENAGVDRKRPRQDAGDSQPINEAAVETPTSSADIPEGVLKIVQEHSNLITSDMISTIQIMVDLSENPSSTHVPESLLTDALRLKVHEVVVEGDSGNKIKESIYIVLDFKNGSWKKTKKTKKIS
jgi:hypothetical protein